MNLYHVLEIAGEGSFGRVYKGRKKHSGEVVALKFMPKVGRSEKELRNLKREIEIMRDLQHPNIVQLFDSFETDTEVVVVTEYAEGQLFQILEDDGHLPESQVRDIACQLVSALYYLHSHRILHRDMKPQNILLGKGGVVKLCDFGFARAMSVSTLVLTSIKGTPLYMSPELVEEKPYDHTADLWSLGCILYELHTGAPPFYTNSIFHLVQMIVRDQVKWPPTMTATCTNFLKGLLTKDPQLRLSWPDLLQHPFVEDGVKVFSDSTVFNPLTETPSPDMVALKLQQVASKTPLAKGKTRLLQHGCKKGHFKIKKIGDCGQSKSVDTHFTPKPTKPQREVNSQCGNHQQSKYGTQISRDYAQEFPSVEVGPQLFRRCLEERRRSLHVEKLETEDYWGKLLQEVDQNRLQVLGHNDLVPRLNSTFLAFKTQLKSECVLEPLEIHQPLTLLSRLIQSDMKDTDDLCQQIGLPHLLFDLIHTIVVNSNNSELPWCVPALGELFQLLLIVWAGHCDWTELGFSQLEEHSKMFVMVLNQPEFRTLAPLAASVLSNFIHHDVPVDLDVDMLMTLFRELWEIHEDCIPRPEGWGMFDGILALLLHTLSEHEGGQVMPCVDPDFFLELCKSVSSVFRKTPPNTDFYSVNGIYSFLSLALSVFTQDPNLCIPLFTDTLSKSVHTLGLLLKPDCLGLFVGDGSPRLQTDWTLDSLSVLSCHLLCFPFALDVPALTMSKILDLYVSSNIIAGLLQVIQTLTPSLLELPLSLLSRLLLCDPERSLPCLGDGDFLMLYQDNRVSVSEDTGGRSAMSLLSDLLQSDVLWEAAVELLSVLSTLTDLDTVTRRHSCCALANLLMLDGAVQWLLEQDVSRALLKAACRDPQHPVRQAAISTLCMFSQQEPIRQMLISLDAKGKLLQASLTFPQMDYTELIEHL
uniref:non-specific serine/threonine protein kinase n=1 Tax=Knipowitschia caucasica TaxID=637954 RepID=A0AAV2J7T9_KNICA